LLCYAKNASEYGGKTRFFTFFVRKRLAFFVDFSELHFEAGCYFFLSWQHALGCGSGILK